VDKDLGHIPFLSEFVIIIGLGCAVTVLLSKLQLPSIAGLLVTGALIGPFGFAWVNDIDVIETFAEIGVVLLLFTIGLEFSLARLKHILQRVALGGIGQVFGTTIVAMGIAYGLGENFSSSLFYGFVFALSSTAIMLRGLSERAELNAPHGRFIVGTLIFQDLCVVPMVLIIPRLGSNQDPATVWTDIGIALGSAAAVMVAALVISKLLVPRLLNWVDASRSRDVFLLSVLTICMGTAWLTSLAGMSLALGAFLAGMVVADTDYQHRAMGEMIPLRDAFMSIFFVSLGMMFNSAALLDSPQQVMLLFLGFTFGKALIATLAATIMKFPARAAWLAGVGLGQFGEFGFVLVKLAEDANLVDPTVTSPLLAAGILSMFFAPVLVRIAPHITAGERVLQPLSNLLGGTGIEELAEDESLNDHVLLVGFGVSGQMCGHALTEVGIRFVALELNAETVRQARKDEQPVYYADGSSVEALKYAHIDSARCALVLINDAAATTQVTDTISRIAPHVPLLIRTRFKNDRSALAALGATEIVAEEIEASIEIVARLLRRLEVPRNAIEKQIRAVRLEAETSDREMILAPRKTAPNKALAALHFDSIVIEKDAEVIGATLGQLNLRQETKALVIAIQRGEELFSPPSPNEPLQANDVVYLAGNPRALTDGAELLCGPLWKIHHTDQFPIAD
jgi:CPA2 family monovalent cation:H+ antiporter-2